MEKQVISNKVFESIQMPTSINEETTGKILYANTFANTTAVSMPEDLKSLLDSDIGLAGNNLLMQLEQKFKYFRNGPWYIDSIDGIIYIHNRKFNEDPVGTYIYQHENGEVLKVQFTTQYVTKQVKAVLTEDIDPETKAIEGGSTTIKNPTDKEEQYVWQYKQIDARIQQPGWYGTRGLDLSGTTTSEGLMTPINAFERNGWQSVLGDPYMVRRKVLDEPNPLEVRKELIKTYGSADPKALKDKAIDNYVAGLSFTQTDAYIKQMVADQATDTMEESLDMAYDRMQTTGDKDQFKADLQKVIRNMYYSGEGQSDMLEYTTCEYVDPREFDPENKPSYKESVADGSGIRLTEKASLLSYNRGLEAMKSNPNIVVMEEDQGGDLIHFGGGIYRKKVKAIYTKREKIVIPAWKLYHNLFSRVGGIDKYTWAAHANSNGGLKNTEKRIICLMTVIGRPSLTSSQKILILNVGKRWSGYWYIKKCTHRMDAGIGYLCDLELVKNLSKGGSVTKRTTISSEKVLSNMALANALTDLGKIKGINWSDIILNMDWTTDEMKYLEVKGGMDKFGNLLVNDVSRDAVVNKIAYNIDNANDPVAVSLGTYYQKGGVYHSNTGLTDLDYGNTLKRASSETYKLVYDAIGADKWDGIFGAIKLRFDNIKREAVKPLDKK